MSSAQFEETSPYIFHTSLVTDLVLDCYSISLVIFSIPSSWRISPIIYFPFDDLDATLVDHLSLYLVLIPLDTFFGLL